MRVLKTRFRSKQAFVAAYDKTLPFGGVFCPTTKPLAQDEEVIVELYFPALPNKVLIRGNVVSWRSALPRLRVRAGALVAFDEEETEKRNFILQVLSGKDAPTIKRRHPRLPVDLPVTWRPASSNDTMPGGLRDISIGGAQLVTDQTLKTDAMVYLDLVAPGGAQPISIAANVTYRTPVGYGLKFQYRNGGGSRRLREVMRRLIHGTP